MRCKNGETVDDDYIMDLIRDDEMVGFCLYCGSERYGTEPDAERYPCESCGKRMVYGAEQLLIMGKVQ